MTTQLLGYPLDITWHRLGFSPDMIDRDFDDFDVSPKWRSSLTVYGHLLPRDQTAESYPGSRILYVKLSCSITGWNPSESLRNEVDLDSDEGGLDGPQSSLWEAIQSDGWAQEYWPCLGAIVQLAVYPPAGSETPLEDYPAIVDFEPKKRELFESATESGEFLSSSLEAVAVQKGQTTLRGTESTHTAGGSVGFSAGPLGGFGGSASYEYSKKSSNSDSRIETKQTDSSRERRETESFSTSYSQMYQLFNGYHLGTNRALFVVAPRPHTASGGEGAEFNLIEGQRKLEGIQEMFLIVEIPDRLDGICFQAALDTGHDVMERLRPVTFLRRRDGFDEPDSGGVFPPPPPPPPPDDGDDEVEVRRLVVTRRKIRNCVSFEEEGGLSILGDPGIRPEVAFPPVVYEGDIPELTTVSTPTSFLATGPEGITARRSHANEMNLFSARAVRTMVSGFTAGRYGTRPFVATRTFRDLAQRSLAQTSVGLSEIAEHGHISRDELELLANERIISLADLFRVGTGQARPVSAAVAAIRNKLLEQVLAPTESARRARRAPRGDARG